ncbi:MAG: class I SAM-dependent methyltransferase [Xanthomonadaceae bacterium]|nr:class I SAM-dependent methyltransferase [Xanthomonadaceae bacterium]
MNQTYASESRVMVFFKSLGLEKIAWSLRRIHTPVDRNALVLEVGSGGNPYPRANVLLDAYEDTSERHWVPLTVDRPFVLGFVENLPFKDKSFDFVIASHVLEHSKDPEKFLSELMRVSKGGYIEVPDAFMERINPYEDHRLEIYEEQKQLIIRKKAQWKLEPDTVSLYERKAKRWTTGEMIPSHPFDFHVRYYWKDKVAFKILNPDADAGWKETIRTHGSTVPSRSAVARVKTWTMKLFRWVNSQNSRNQKIDLMSLLQCVSCKSSDLKKVSSSEIQCQNCKRIYFVKNNIPVMQ